MTQKEITDRKSTKDFRTFARMQVFRKISEVWDRLRGRKLFRICTDKYILATIIFMVIYITDHNGMLTLLRNKKEIERQKEAIEEYRSSISAVEARIKSLSSNKDSIEAFAREEYYYHREGEDVFIMEE